MTRTKRPTGLIRHRSLSGKPVQILRPRILIYVAVLMLMTVSLLTVLGTRQALAVTVLRAIDTPYFEQTAAGGRTMIVNAYRLHAHNQSDSDIKIAVALVAPPAADVALTVPEPLLTLGKDQSRMIPFTVGVPKEELAGRANLPLRIRVQDQTYEVEFVAPGL